MGSAQSMEPMAQASAARPATAGTLDRVRAKGKLVLGYYTHAQPMSYRDPSGHAAGYSVMLCQKIADGVKAELRLQQLAVEWVPLTPATGMQNVQQGKIDLLCGSDAASLKNRATSPSLLPIFPGGISSLLRADAPKALQNVLAERPAPYKPIWRASPFSPIQHKTLSVVAGTSAVDWGKERASKLNLIANARYGRQLRHGRGEGGQRRLRRALRRPCRFARTGKAQPRRTQAPCADPSLHLRAAGPGLGAQR